MQRADLFFQTVVAVLFVVLPPGEVFRPGGIVAALHLDVGAVQRQDVVHAAVQELPVVGDQNEPPLALEIGGHAAAGFGVQVVGGLVDEQEPPLVQEQRGQQGLGLFPRRQGRKRAVQRIVGHAQAGKFAFQFPFLCVGADPGQHGAGGAFGAGNGIGEVVEAHRGLDAAGIFVVAHQQAQQRRFAAAVAADEAQLPVGVDLERYIVKDGFAAGRIRKSQMFHTDHCHVGLPPLRPEKGKKLEPQERRFPAAQRGRRPARKGAARLP